MCGALAVLHLPSEHPTAGHVLGEGAGHIRPDDCRMHLLVLKIALRYTPILKTSGFSVHKNSQRAYRKCRFLGLPSLSPQHARVKESALCSALSMTLTLQKVLSLSFV